MKNLKLIPFAVAIALVGFTSCADEKKDNKIVEENTLQNETEVLRGDVKNVNEINEMEAKKMANMVDSNVFTEYKSTGIVKGWAALNDLNTGMKSLSGKDYVSSKKMAGNLAATINDLTLTRPDWLKTEEISEDIADLEKDYKKLMSEDNTNEDKFRRDLEEVNEQYEDLVEEVNETIERYMEISRDATEDYIDEMKDGDPKKAQEELDKGMKKMEKVADDK